MFLVLVFAILGCNNSKGKEKKGIQAQQNCELKEMQKFKRALRKVNEIILKEHPILRKNYEAQPININKEVSGQIDRLFLNYCKDIEEAIEFKRFALIYLYNFKFNQYKCCVPGETGVIGEGFMNTNHRKKKDAFGIAMKYLLRENGISKDDIVYNGFTQLQINFETTIKYFEHDNLVMNLIKSANNEMDKAYKIEMAH